MATTASEPALESDDVSRLRFIGELIKFFPRFCTNMTIIC